MIRGPTDQNRTVIIGRTGSGKSQFACALTSTRNFNEMPWVILDYKGEDLILDIKEACKGGMKELKVTDNPPKEPGLYHMKLKPVIDNDAIDAFLWKCHSQGNIGLNIDEGFALPQRHGGNAFDVILTQGRSLHIPVIVLYQRPVWMSRFAVAQADFFAVFEQNDVRDLKATEQFIRPMKGKNNDEISVHTILPAYHCLWFDVGKAKTSLLAPAPPREEIIATFVERLKPRKKRFFI